MTLSFTIFSRQKILIEPICFFKFYAALIRFSIPHILMKSHFFNGLLDAGITASGADTFLLHYFLELNYEEDETCRSGTRTVTLNLVED